MGSISITGPRGRISVIGHQPLVSPSIKSIPFHLGGMARGCAMGQMPIGIRLQESAVAQLVYRTLAANATGFRPL